MESAILQDLGLTPAEIKVYFSLLELGTSKAGEIIKHSQLQNSVVHFTLGKLVEKGLASFVRRGRVKHYQPTDPRNICRWLDEKKHRLELVIPQLIERQKVKETQEAEVFEGVRGFKAMAYKFIEDAEPGDEYLIFAFITAMEQRDREIYSFYREFVDDRLRRGIEMKGIAHECRRPLFEEFRYDLSYWLFVNFPTLQNVSVFRNKIIMTPWQYKPVSYLITSKHVADNFREYFYLVWNQHRRPKKKAH